MRNGTPRTTTGQDVSKDNLPAVVNYGAGSGTETIGVYVMTFRQLFKLYVSQGLSNEVAFCKALVAVGR